MKGLFIPEITAEMFRNGCLEGIEALMAEGKIYDIEYEAEPRRGKWEATVGGVYCSECADAWSDEVESMIQSFNYCPNCGAKMEEEE